ncbi:methyl-accepting chemotaxis protein [Noviherbaspirillum sp. Root189]|uniref:methyl-accepting chemotaxis protein n=1 Tax=Noviherbaspirillum sp. Root189 TaxID=1736487 RepID=UPI00070F0206|nr:methyl-accepting chemotaxis protein [Noviherbaspirillum sp. Root189]KRB70669.1 chemotaxis protein [Noviherbaspirillum sp. Root189]
MFLSRSVSRLSTKARIGLGFAVVLVLMVVLTVAGILQVNAIHSSLKIISEVNSVKQRYAINFRGSVHDRAISLRDVTLVSDEAALNTAVAEIEHLARDYEAAAVPLDRVFNEEAGNAGEDYRILADIKVVEARTLPLIHKIIALRRSGDIDAARALMFEQARPAFVAWLAAINRFIDYQEKLNLQESARAQETARGFVALMLVLCAAALTLGAIVAVLITRQIIRTLGAEPDTVKALAEAVGRGELFHAARLRKGDDTSIMASLVRMAGTLGETVTGVRRAAEEVAATSAEISEGNRNLSTRTEAQAGSLEKTASSMEELTATVKQNADNAREANGLAKSASAVAEKGGSVVAGVIETMGSINTSAQKISDIISVIDGIAFQTNILALNAAVEAARAGDQGRGFAVVAGEVRNLAQRSASAAREIKALIGDSVDKVEAGTRLVDDAGRTMKEIVASIQRVTSIMAEIMSASAEQSVGIEDVNRAVGQMDRMTQENAALVEQAATGATALHEQAARLAAAVAVFRFVERTAIG